MSQPQNPGTPQEPLRPSDAQVIVLLNGRLDEKAQNIRRLEDVEIALTALVNDLIAKVTSLEAHLDQANMENALLRERCGLSPDEPVLPMTEESADPANAPDGAELPIDPTP